VDRVDVQAMQGESGESDLWTAASDQRGCGQVPVIDWLAGAGLTLPTAWVSALVSQPFGFQPSLVTSCSACRSSLAAGASGRLRRKWDEGAARPFRDHPLRAAFV
jgi:hypothetical protein